jgi:hypothetical protein
MTPGNVHFAPPTLTAGLCGWWQVSQGIKTANFRALAITGSLPPVSPAARPQSGHFLSR